MLDQFMDLPDIVMQTPAHDAAPVLAARLSLLLAPPLSPLLPLLLPRIRRSENWKS